MEKNLLEKNVQPSVNGSVSVTEKPQDKPGHYCFTRAEGERDVKLEGNAPVNPEISGYIPFEVAPEQIEDLIKKAVPSGLMRPMGLTKNISAQRQYVPFWVFDVEAQGVFTAKVKGYEFKWNKNRCNTYEEKIEGVYHLKDIAVDASNALDDNTMNELEPYDFSKLEPYSSKALSGEKIAQADTQLSVCMVKAQHLSRLTVAREITRDLGENRFLENDPISQDRFLFDTMDARLVLLPVYSAVCACEGRFITLYINGQTGEVVGSVPVTKYKHVLLTSLALLAFSGVLALLDAVGVVPFFAWFEHIKLFCILALSLIVLLYFVVTYITFERSRNQLTAAKYGVHMSEGDLKAVSHKRTFIGSAGIVAVASPNEPEKGLLRAIYLPIVWIIRVVMLVLYFIPSLILTVCVEMIFASLPYSLVFIPIALVLTPVMLGLRAILERSWFIQELIRRRGRIPLIIADDSDSSDRDSFRYSRSSSGHSSSGHSSSGFSRSSFGGGHSSGGGAGRRR